MENNALVRQVIEVLAKQGLSDEQISDFLVDLTKAGFAHLMTKAVEHLSQEDLERIESLPEGESQAEIKRLYKEKVGKDPEEEMQTFFAKFSEGFLAEYEKQQASVNSPAASIPQDPELEQLKQKLYDELFQALIDGLKKGIITEEESGTSAEFILDQFSKVTSKEELMTVLEAAATGWKAYQGVYAKIQDAEQIGKIENDLAKLT